MAKKVPPVCKTHAHINVTVWELLEREGLLDRSYSETWLWCTLSPKQRRQHERERQMLQAARIAGYTPPRTQRRKMPDLWLYLTTTRGTHYRLHGDAAIQIWKRNPPQPGIGGGGWGWYAASSRGVRWLSAISSALFLRSVRAECAAADAQAVPLAAAPASDCTADIYIQLSLFD
jgi:hypothetical protein